MTTEIAIIEDKLKLIPEHLFKKFGCSGSCFHRHTDRCIVKPGTDYPEGLICRQREEWLASLLPSYEKKPSYSEVMLDIAKALGHMRHVKDYELMESLEAGRKKIEENIAAETDEEKLKLLNRQIKNIDYNIMQAFNRWQSAWKQSQNIENERLRMDTPKKVEITRKVSPVDVADMLDRARKKVIEAEFRESVDEVQYGDK